MRYIINEVHKLSRIAGTPKARLAWYKLRCDEVRDEVFRLRNLWHARLEMVVSGRDAMWLSFMSNKDWSYLQEMVRFMPSGDVDISVDSPCGEVLPSDVLEAYDLWHRGARNGAGHYYQFSGEDVVVTEEGALYERDSAWYCSFCDGWHSNDMDGTEVVTRLTGTRIAAKVYVCDTTGVFFCDKSERCYCSDTFSVGTTVDGDTICEEWANEAGWVYHDGHERWAAHSCEFFDDDDDDYNECHIPSYHSASRGSIIAELHRMRDEPDPVGARGSRRYGLEVEVHFNYPYQRGEWYDTRALTPHIAERDGSLDEECGVEIISIPVKYDDWLTGGRGFFDVIEDARECGASGWTHRSRYGTHVNIDTRGLSPTVLALFYCAVNNMGPFWTVMSGRSTDDLTYRKIPDIKDSAHLGWHAVRGAIDWEPGIKYQPVHVRDSNVIEMRSFSSNVRPGALMEYIDLCAATIDWASKCASPPEDGHYPALSVFGFNVHQRFLTWLMEQDGYEALRRQINRIGLPALMQDESELNLSMRSNK